MKRRLSPIAFLLCLTLLCSSITWGCGKSEIEDDNTLVVLNYGKYLDKDVLLDFQEETGIRVKYEEYESPEEMYTKYKSGAIDYDVMCTSEYIVERLINEGEVLEINYDNIPLYANIDERYVDYSRAYDPDAKYTLPYFFGTVGILYNTTMVDEEDLGSWDILWNPKYRSQIIMENSVRDSFVPALRLLDHSISTTDEQELNEALELLCRQKDLVYSYLVDAAADEMVAGNAAMALIYSGEAAYAQDYNEDLEYMVPEEGSNMWIDSWFIPRTCKHKENAEKFLNYLCREDVALKNFEYVWYATPNRAAFEALDEDIQQDTTVFATEETLDNCELFTNLDDDTTKMYDYLWKRLKSY